MKITFLGTGGGRFSAISQRRMTGGFRIDNLNGKNYHVDPGPGALVRTYQFGFDPRNLDGVFVSHAHTDHYNDDSFKNFVDFQNPFCDCHSKLDLCDIFVLKRPVWS